jgi:hypothetical protein
MSLVGVPRNEQELLVKMLRRSTQTLRRSLTRRAFSTEPVAKGTDKIGVCALPVIACGRWIAAQLTV